MWTHCGLSGYSLVRKLSEKYSTSVFRAGVRQFGTHQPTTQDSLWYQARTPWVFITIKSQILCNHTTLYINHTTLYINHKTLYINHTTLYINHTTLYINHTTLYINHTTLYINHTTRHFILTIRGSLILRSADNIRLKLTEKWFW
jgi:hypothetical protein